MKALYRCKKKSQISDLVETKTLLYLANFFAKICTISVKTESGFVHYKYMSIFFCNIQIILEYHYQLVWLAKFWLAFNRLHDISNIHTKFDNNRSSSFGDYVSNKNGYRHQTDGNKRLVFSYCGGHETSRKHKSGNSSDGLDY